MSIEVNNPRESQIPFLTIVVVTYNRNLHLKAFLAALALQTDLGFNVIVIHDGPNEDAERLVSEFNNSLSGYVTYLETPLRFNDFGHSLREIGIERVETDYVLVTNEDNYYAPVLIATLRNALRSTGAKLALLDLVHSYPDVYTNKLHIVWIKVLDKLKKHGITINVGRRSPYSFVKVKPRRGMIDIGSMVIASSVAKSIGFPWRDYDADGKFAEALMEKLDYKDVVKVSGVLFVHN